MNEVTSSDGTTIAFDRSGEGPPVMLAGGALSDWSGGAPLAALLMQRFTAFTYDRRGRGDSGDTPPYAVDDARRRSGGPRSGGGGIPGVTPRPAGTFIEGKGRRDGR
jgi:pimeloyl-ACP methyl ester carboxylesterase